MYLVNCHRNSHRNSMTRRGLLGVLLGAVSALALSACGQSESKRYKMTVEVETPEGVRSGYAVREIMQSTPPSVPMLGEDRGSIKVRGEAVAVDLPNGQTLFALLSSSKGRSDHASFDIWSMFRQLDQQTIELWPDAPITDAPAIKDPVPMLVIFSDIRDPKSVKKVDPEDLAATFGDDIALKSITAKLTDDPVTTGIEKQLGWLDNLADYRSDPSNPFTSTLPTEIGDLRSN